MLTYIIGDLFQSPARTLVNPVNTAGAMGKGLAADFKRHYPDMFARYRALCQAGHFHVGQLWLYKTPHKWILNFPTKRHWRDPSRLEYIEAGLQKFASTYAEKGITSISFPLLGAGLGGLDWETQVRPLMEHYLAPLPIDVFIHLHQPDNPFAPPRDDQAIHAWLRGQPQPPAFAAFWRDLQALLAAAPTLQTLDDHTSFTAQADDDNHHLIIHPAGADPILLSESTLAELWLFLRVAGYYAPSDLPGDLDRCAPFIVALLTRLDYIHPVILWRSGEERQIGLHLIAPLPDDPPRPEALS